MTAVRKPRPNSGYRQSMLAKVHIAKKDLGLDDTTYRDVLELVTGKRSAGKCTNAQIDAVISHLKGKGWKQKRKNKIEKSGAAGKYLAKCQALWISGYHLGVVRNRDDAAMIAFIKRQTGLDSERFLIDAADAMKAIEALKSWLTREARVNWRVNSSPHAPPHINEPAYRVVQAQWLKLIEVGAVHSTIPALPFDDLDNYAGVVTRHPNFSFYKQADWNELMSALGRKLRYEMGK